jgi:hypothetical protein
MMSRPLIIELLAYGPSRGGNHPKTLRGPVGKERPAGPRSHTGEVQCGHQGGSVSVTCGCAVVESTSDLQTFLSRAGD